MILLSALAKLFQFLYHFVANLLPNLCYTGCYLCNGGPDLLFSRNLSDDCVPC